MDTHRVRPRSTSPVLPYPVPSFSDNRISRQYQGRTLQSLPTAAKQTHPVAQAREHTQAPRPAAAAIDFSDRHLRVNFVRPGLVPLDQLVPPPGPGLALKKDPWLTWLGSKPGDVESPSYVGGLDALAWTRDQLQERQRVEAQNGEFVFQPLLITLENIQRFIHHTRDGHQFPAVLNADKAAALARLEEHTAALVTAQAPYYKRTLYLALSLLTLCEIITRRQVFDPLLKEQRVKHLSSG